MIAVALSLPRTSDGARTSIVNRGVPDGWGAISGALGRVKDRASGFGRRLGDARRVPWGEETPILMGMDVEGDLHLLVPVSDGPPAQDFPDLNGLKVRHRTTDNGQFLGLVATAPHERVFTPVCREVVQAVHVQDREPWAAVAAIIRQWQSAWRPTRQYMTQAVQALASPVNCSSSPGSWCLRLDPEPSCTGGDLKVSAMTLFRKISTSR